jgi:hypothetical protein
MIKCNFDPFEDDNPNLSFLYSTDGFINKEQVELMIKRLTEYRKLHRHVLGCLNNVSAEHYKVCDFETLKKLKQPIQILLYAREGLKKVDESLEKDIETCQQYLEMLNGIVPDKTIESD